MIVSECRLLYIIDDISEFKNKYKDSNYILRFYNTSYDLNSFNFFIDLETIGHYEELITDTKLYSELLQSNKWEK